MTSSPPSSLIAQRLQKALPSLSDARALNVAQRLAHPHLSFNDRLHTARDLLGKDTPLCAMREILAVALGYRSSNAAHAGLQPWVVDRPNPDLLNVYRNLCAERPALAALLLHVPLLNAPGTSLWQFTPQGLALATPARAPLIEALTHSLWGHKTRLEALHAQPDFEPELAYFLARGLIYVDMIANGVCTSLASYGPFEASVVFQNILLDFEAQDAPLVLEGLYAQMKGKGFSLETYSSTYRGVEVGAMFSAVDLEHCPDFSCFAPTLQTLQDPHPSVSPKAWSLEMVKGLKGAKALETFVALAVTAKRPMSVEEMERELECLLALQPALRHSVQALVAYFALAELLFQGLSQEGITRMAKSPVYAKWAKHSNIL